MRAAASFLRGTEEKQPVKELRLTALGEAIGIVASVASRCEMEQLAKIKEAIPLRGLSYESMWRLFLFDDKDIFGTCLIACGWQDIYLQNYIIMMIESNVAAWLYISII